MTVYTAQAFGVCARGRGIRTKHRGLNQDKDEEYSSVDSKS